VGLERALEAVESGMRCPKMFWEGIPHNWISVGKVAFSLGWQGRVERAKL